MTINKEHIYYSHEELSKESFPHFIVNNEHILFKININESTSINVENLSSREVLLTILKNGLRTIPVIDENKKIFKCVKVDTFQKIEDRTCVIAKTPAKISFAGGGSDFTDYLEHGNEGEVLNCAINLFATCTLSSATTNKIIISIEGNEKETSLEEIQLNSLNSKEFGLIESVLKLISPKQGFKVSISTDFPIGSGLGGSSAVTISILTAFNEIQENKWTREEIIYLAFICERIIFNISGGWQDQYTSTMGGLNEIKLTSSRHDIKNVIKSIDILNSLQNHLIITDTGISRNSGIILDDLRKSIIKNTKLLDYLTKSKELVKIMINNLLESNFEGFSDNLQESGKAKRDISKEDFSSKINSIFNYAKESGVKSGRLLGAGAGGHFLFFVDPRDKDRIISKLNAKGFSSRAISINHVGTSAKIVLIK